MNEFRKPLHIENILLCAALLLVLAIVGHAFEFHHEHSHEIFGTDAAHAYLHGGDKKYWWIVILAAYFFIARSTALLSKTRLLIQHATLHSLRFFDLHFDISKLFNPIRIALREGRLQRKICD